MRKKPIGTGLSDVPNSDGFYREERDNGVVMVKYVPPPASAVTVVEERQAWDRYAAYLAPCYQRAESAAKVADEMLEARRKRFGGGKP